MWKVGDIVQTKEEYCSFALKYQTLKIERVDTDQYVWISRKGQSNGERDHYPVKKENLEKISNNPFVRIKRMFCRAFECSYK